MNRRQLVSIAVLLGPGGLMWRLGSARDRSREGSHQLPGVDFGFEVGERAPDFDLRLLTGGRLKLSSLEGKAVFLNFWATWCAPCRVEVPWLVEFDDTYRAQGLEIVGVCMDDLAEREKIAAFTQQRGVNYQILLGNSRIAEAYGGLRFLPQSFLIDGDGIIRRALTGLGEKTHLENAIQDLLRADW